MAQVFHGDYTAIHYMYTKTDNTLSQAHFFSRPLTLSPSLALSHTHTHTLVYPLLFSPLSVPDFWFGGGLTGSTYSKMPGEREEQLEAKITHLVTIKCV